jgi:hypothetical protein
VFNCCGISKRQRRNDHLQQEFTSNRIAVESRMKMSFKSLFAMLLLMAGASTASAQTYWGHYSSGLKARGYYGTPYDGGPQYGSGGGDQYGYGPAYSYARQAPPRYYPWR